MRTLSHSDRLHCLNDIQLVSEGPTAWTVGTKQDGSMSSCCLVQILTTWLSQLKSRLIRARFFPILNYFLFLANKGALVWASAAVAHFLQGSTCCVFRYDIDALVELQLVVLTTSSSQDALSCCHMIGRLAICVHNKVDLTYSLWVIKNDWKSRKIKACSSSRRWQIV